MADLVDGFRAATSPRERLSLLAEAAAPRGFREQSLRIPDPDTAEAGPLGGPASAARRTT